MIPINLRELRHQLQYTWHHRLPQAQNKLMKCRNAYLIERAFIGDTQEGNYSVNIYSVGRVLWISC